MKFELEKSRKINNNQQVGIAKIYLGDDLIHEEKIYVTKKQVKKSLFTKIKEWLNG